MLILTDEQDFVDVMFPGIDITEEYSINVQIYDFNDLATPIVVDRDLTLRPSYQIQVKGIGFGLHVSLSIFEALKLNK